MPELPEVETITRDLSDKIIDKKIVKVEVFLKRIVKGNFNDFLTILQYNKIKRIGRRGKLIIVDLSRADKKIIIHLRMTGQLVYCRNEKIVAGGHSDNNEVSCHSGKHTRLQLEFDDGSRLIFNDLRTFGFWQIVNDKELEKITSRFGCEALEIDKKYLQKICASKSASIKALLLNQELIAGIGNIYADEALFSAGIMPNRTGASLNEEELRRLAKSIKQVLKKAINFRGTTFNNYVDADGKKGDFVKMLKVYGRKNLPCLQCGAKIKKIKLAQRGTHFCARCQV